MQAKITITDVCGAHCVTCPQHEVSPQRTMSVNELRDTLRMLHLSGLVATYFVNGVGDYLMLDTHQEYSDVLSQFYCDTGLELTVTTNCGFSGSPRIACSKIICSLNAVTPATFDAAIGLPCGFDHTVYNIHKLIDSHGVVEIHSLVHAGNPNPDAQLLELFGMTRARIRVSSKVENQMRTEVPDGPWVPCEYLRDKLCVYPQGRIRQCNHDFFGQELVGNVAEMSNAVAELLRRYGRQYAGFMDDGICAKCNFNIYSPNSVRYIK